MQSALSYQVLPNASPYNTTREKRQGDCSRE
jgi:hypothetical protein